MIVLQFAYLGIAIDLHACAQIITGFIFYHAGPKYYPSRQSLRLETSK